MANSNSERQRPGGKLPGGIGCLGLLLLGILVISSLGVTLRPSTLSLDEQSDTASLESMALTQVEDEMATAETVQTLAQGEPSTAEATAEAPAQVTEVSSEYPTATATETPTRAPSETPTGTPSKTPTGAVVETRAPAEEAVALPTNTPIPPPLPTPRDSYSWTLEVPILMYHYISQAPEDANKYRQDLSVAPEDFREQMTYLVENGFETVDLYDLSLAIADKVELPPKPIIITMDDGYRDNYENAFPILEELGLTATFFLVTEFIDQNNEIYLDWAMVEEMAAAGMRFEPHSKTHPDLTANERDFIIWEVQGSRETIAAHVGYLPRYFAYPSGRFNEEVQQIIAELDFWGAVTTLGGVWNGYNDRFEWPRVRIRDLTSLDEFSAMIE